MDKVCYSKRHREKATEWFAGEEFSKFMSLSNIFISSSLLKDFFFPVVSWLLFLFQPIQETVPLSSGFYCFSGEVNQQSKS